MYLSEKKIEILKKLSLKNYKYFYEKWLKTKKHHHSKVRNMTIYQTFRRFYFMLSGIDNDRLIFKWENVIKDKKEAEIVLNLAKAKKEVLDKLKKEGFIKHDV